jgi:methylenetetrahydrofolate reductase (NADPH)
MASVPTLSRFESVLRSGRFAITAELNPPDSADANDVYDRAFVLSTVCDAINVTDASGANCHMSSIGACAILTRAGYEPVMQVSCRDRNRIAIQGDLLGAAALGIKNVLCITGDGIQAGDQREARPVFDLESITLLRTAQIMRDQGRFLSGRALSVSPSFFLGAVENPFAPPQAVRAARLAKKVDAGAQFIQTQFCFDLPLLREFMTRVGDLGLDRHVFIIVGVGPLRSAKTAEWIRTHVPGVNIPDEVVNRLRRTQADRQRATGKQMCVEMIQAVREIPGVAGVHVMAYRQEELVAEIVEESGLLQRRLRDASAPEGAHREASL